MLHSQFPADFLVFHRKHRRTCNNTAFQRRKIILWTVLVMKNCQKHGRDTIEHCTPVLLHLFQYIYCFIVFQKMSLSPAVNTAENSRCYSKAVKQRYGNTQLVLLTPAHLSGNLCRVIHQAEMRQHYPFRSAGCA